MSLSLIGSEVDRVITLTDNLFLPLSLGRKLVTHLLNYTPADRCLPSFRSVTCVPKVSSGGYVW